MKCINVEIYRIQNSPIFCVKLIKENIIIQTEHIIPLIYALNLKYLSESIIINTTCNNTELNINTSNTCSRLDINIGIICSINGEAVLKFEKDILSWNEDENVIGVTKYNLITASNGWILEEIEELL